jgi:hypothetical protein
VRVVLFVIQRVAKFVPADRLAAAADKLMVRPALAFAPTEPLVADKVNHDGAGEAAQVMAEAVLLERAYDWLVTLNGPPTGPMDAKPVSGVTSRARVITKFAPQ